MTTNRRPGGFFRSAVETMIAARQRQADRYVSRTLLAYDEQTLRAHGFDRADLERRAR